MRNFLKTIKYPDKKEVIDLTMLITASIFMISSFIFGVDAVITTCYNLII